MEFDTKPSQKAIDAIMEAQSKSTTFTALMIKKGLMKLGAGKIIDQVPFDDPIRALSWKQPYASLMLHGKIETRVWDTKYRGYVLICASKSGSNYESVFNISKLQTGNIQDKLYPLFHLQDPWGHMMKELPNGKAIAIGKLVDCRPMTKADEEACYVEYQEPWIEPKKTKGPVSSLIEKRLWCHVYEDVHAIEPFDWKGKQGWSTLTWEDRKKIIIL